MNKQSTEPNPLEKTSAINGLARGVLGALILSPGLLESFDLRDTDFPAGPFRLTFSAIAGLWEESRAAEIDPLILAERIGGEGAASFAASLLDGNIKLAEVAFGGRVAELRKRAALDRIEAKAKDGLRDLDEIRPDLEAYDKLDQPAADLTSSLMTGAAMQALNLNVEWTIESLVPSRSITVLHSRSGLGKTWLCLQAGKAVSEGEPIFNLTTKKRPVFYVDYENPLPLMVERTRRLDVRDVNFWHLSAALKPPKLDGEDWTLYKQLPSSSLIIIDTARACQDGDENSSQDVGLVMGRLKEIREQGRDILLLHHAGKLDERGYKGSTAWVDLADHVLSLHRVKRGTLEEIDDDGGPDLDALFSLGTGAKTRFAPARIYLRFDPTREGFILAEDPDQEALDSIRERIAEAGQGTSQTDLYEWGKSALDLTKKGKLVYLLQKGERQGLWNSEKPGRSRLYHAS